MKKNPFSPPAGASIARALLLSTLILLISAGQAVQAQNGATFSASQLQNMVAPVALYPDQLLAYVLTSSTMPDEVIQASNYLSSQGGKVTSMPDNDWDPSVKALLNFPDVLGKMNGNLLWTKTLGQAVILQQQDVLKAIQSYRSSAFSAGSLQSNQYQTVSQSSQGITIQPASSQTVYVPTYDTTGTAAAAAPILSFGAGVALGSWWNYRNCNWGDGNITVNPTYFNAYNYHPGSAWAASTGTVWAPATAAVNSFRAAAGAGYYPRVGEAAAVPYAGSLDSSIYHGLSGYGYGGVHAGETTWAGNAAYHEGATAWGGNTAYHQGATATIGNTTFHAGETTVDGHTTYHAGETSRFGGGAFHEGATFNSVGGWADSAAGFRGGVSRFGGAYRGFGGFRR